MSSPIAQLVEQMTVNHWVAGSSPAWGASRISQLVSLPSSPDPSKIKSRRKKGALNRVSSINSTVKFSL